eukprot:TRINITY_DN32148_c0_g1_i1.p1 TRINITY_DN32148_c0_g1~~TRINITY_DN32148_c0_g1_i1.p1  ORF type:complete len:280 (-),score=39.79 TRINITY_DN32148_c0_g1_i1:276-1115(-)
MPLYSKSKHRLTAFFENKTHDDWKNLFWYTCLETFAIGWIDVTYFVKYSCFVSMMTGNVVQMGRSMAQEGFSVDGFGFFIIMIFMFWVGVMSFRVLRYFTGRKSKRCFAALFLGYYALYMLAAFYADHCNCINKRWPAILLPPMFGVHGSVMIKEGLGKYPGIAMTSNSVNLNYFFFDVIIKGWANIPDKQKHDAFVILGNFVAMLAGAFCAALLIMEFPSILHNHGMSVPPLLILLYMLLWNDSLFKLEDDLESSPNGQHYRHTLPPPAKSAPLLINC